MEPYSHYCACDQLVEALQNVGVLEGQAILAHSSLGLPGKIKGVSINDAFGNCVKIYNSFDVVFGLKNAAG